MKLEKAQAEYDELHSRYPKLSSEENDRYMTLAFVILQHRGNKFDELLKALRRLEMAALCHENTAGDPCRYLETKAELRAAAVAARSAISESEEVKGI